MRLDAHAKLSSDRRALCAPGGRSPVGLPPFLAGMTQTARSALEDALDESIDEVARQLAVVTARETPDTETETAIVGFDFEREIEERDRTRVERLERLLGDRAAA